MSGSTIQSFWDPSPNKKVIKELLNFNLGFNTTEPILELELLVPEVPMKF